MSSGSLVLSAQVVDPKLLGHTDHPPPDAWPLGSYRMVKVLVFLWDVPHNGGELALVPGSHRLPAGPGEVLQTRFKDGLGAPSCHLRHQSN